MKRHARIDRVLEHPQVRAQFHEFRHHFAVAAGRHDTGDREGHLVALEEGRAVAWRIVDAIVAEPENGNLPAGEVFRYLKNVAMQEMVGPMAKQDRIVLSELEVRFPRGRPPSRRPMARQRLIEPSCAGSSRRPRSPALAATAAPAHPPRAAWGDLSDAEFQAARDATRSSLADLPDGDRIRSFDAYRARVLALPEAIEAASPARREELGRIVLQRVVVRDRHLETIEWTPPVRPFFERQRECPQGDSNP